MRKSGFSVDDLNHYNYDYLGNNLAKTSNALFIIEKHVAYERHVLRNSSTH